MTKKILLFISLMGMLSLYSFNGYNIPIAVSEAPVAGNYTYAADVSNLYNPGKNILLYVTRNWDGGSIRRWFDTDLPAILAQDGFTVTVQGRDTLPELSDTILANYDQLWFVSTEGGAILDSEEVQAILEFHNNGKGILVMGDGCSYKGPANQFSDSLGVQFVSSTCCDCDHCGGGIISCPISTSGFVPYDIWNGVSEIGANLNEGDLAATSPAQVIATHNGINMVAVRDADGGRIAWDATWYRFTDSTANPYMSITHYDNAQYVRNLAKWLAGCLAAPLPYSLLSPQTTDSVKTPVTLTWQKPIDPDPNDTIRYDLYLGRFADSTEVYKYSLFDTTFTDSLGLGTWHWKVKAYDKCGTEIWSNQNWSFYVYVCGNCNWDSLGQITVADVVYLINYLFKGGPAPVLLKAGEVNCDAKVTVADAVYLINYLFKGGPKPCQNCP